MIPVPQMLMIAGKVAPYLAGAVGSFAEAASQKKLIEEAERDAAKALADARAKLMQAPLEELQVPTEAYETAMQNITAQSMQLIEAARETGARELGANVGRIGAAGLNATEQQREAMGKDIYARDVAVAQDKARRLGALSGIDIRQSEGANLAAAQAAEARGRAISAAVGALGQAAGAGLESLALYGYGSPDAQRMAAREMESMGRRSIFGDQGQFSIDQFLGGFGLSPMATGAPEQIQRLDSSMFGGLEDVVPLISRR
jgi:hypothetical protein